MTLFFDIGAERKWRRTKKVWLRVARTNQSYLELCENNKSTPLHRVNTMELDFNLSNYKINVI